MGSSSVIQWSYLGYSSTDLIIALHYVWTHRIRQSSSNRYHHYQVRIDSHSFYAFPPFIWWLYNITTVNLARTLWRYRLWQGIWSENSSLFPRLHLSYWLWPDPLLTIQLSFQYQPRAMLGILRNSQRSRSSDIQILQLSETGLDFLIQDLCSPHASGRSSLLIDPSL